MSISWYIYRAEPGAGAISTWDTDRSERIAPIEVVKERLSTMFPNLRWDVHSFQIGGGEQLSQSALACDYRPGDEYLDLHLKADPEGMSE